MAYYYSPFRKKYDKKSSGGSCVFCDEQIKKHDAIRDNAGSIIENEHYYWAIAAYPKFEGHTMLVPKRHIANPTEENDREIIARQQLLTIAVNALNKLYAGNGIEIFIQSGPDSAASISHIHWHVVPAHPDDPLRGFEKLGHFYTVNEGEEKILIFPHEIRLAGEELKSALAQHINELGRKF